jgi:hypothetical protein
VRGRILQLRIILVAKYIIIAHSSVVDLLYKRGLSFFFGMSCVMPETYRNKASHRNAASGKGYDQRVTGIVSFSAPLVDGAPQRTDGYAWVFENGEVHTVHGKSWLPSAR